MLSPTLMLIKPAVLSYRYENGAPYAAPTYSSPFFALAVFSSAVHEISSV
jgi:hypothetical protein